eukprot:315937_1
MALQCFDIVDQKQFHVCKLDIDIGSYLDKMRLAGSNQSFQQRFKMLDLCGWVELWPKGIGATEGHTSMFIRFDADLTDKRQINLNYLKASHINGDSSTSSASHDASTYKIGWGWNDFFKLDDIKPDSYVSLTIQIEVNPPTKEDKKMENTESNSMEALHEYSMKHGDITIAVSEANEEEIREPPRKKRKIDAQHGLDDDDDDISATKTIKAISGVLKSESPVFAAMLENDMKEKETKTIHVSAKSYEDVQDMLHFLTTKKLRKGADVISLMDLAQLYQMESIQNICWTRMFTSLNDDNFVQTVCCFDKYRIKKGYDLLIEYAKRNSKNIEELDDFDQLSHSFQYLVCNKKK